MVSDPKRRERGSNGACGKEAKEAKNERLENEGRKEPKNRMD